MAAANAASGETVGATAEYLFRSISNGGEQVRGAKAISVYNGDSAETLLVRADWWNDDEFMPIPAGKALTLENEDIGGEIRFITAKRGGSNDVTNVGWGVTKIGHGTAAQ